LKQLERIYRRRVPSQEIITPELCRYLAEVSFDLGRQVGVLITRRGEIAYVVVGNQKEIAIPPLDDYRLGRRRFRGLRFLHTHLKGEPLSKDDLTDLALLRLDLVGSIGVGDAGLPSQISVAHLLPSNREGKTYEVLPSRDAHHINDVDFEQLIGELEREISRVEKGSREIGESELAILVGVRGGHGQGIETEDSVEELKELARTSSVQVLDTIIQNADRMNPKYLLGKGKLRELIIRALQSGASLLIFDRELTPAQVRSISEVTEMKVLDRTQLILDIFARHAHTLDGKIQVELAQLKYILPRLKENTAAFSRLAGGIGGRGPGEQKLEVDRRHIRDRISHLEKKLEDISKSRRQRRSKRSNSAIPIVSIIGYTNAGKSTLLNALTNSHVLVEDLYFATLDTATRRLRFPREREVIITDTVGFLRSLPPDLLGAFRSTLEELGDANLLLHVVDLSNPHFSEQMDAVTQILSDLNLSHIPILQVFNKIDKVSEEVLCAYRRRYEGVFISAQSLDTLAPLIIQMERILEDHGCFHPQSSRSSHCQGGL
jgi:GTP-binding protein HflX